LAVIVLVVVAGILVLTVGAPSIKKIFGGGAVEQKIAVPSVPSFAPLDGSQVLPPSAGVETAPSADLGQVPALTETAPLFQQPAQSVPKASLPSQAGASLPSAMVEKGTGAVKAVSNTPFMNALAHEMGKFGYEPSRAGSAVTDVLAKILAFIIWVVALWGMFSLCNRIFLSGMEFPISAWLKWALALSVTLSLRLPAFSPNVTLPVLQASGTSEVLGMFKTASFISKFWIFSVFLAVILSVGYLVGLVINKPAGKAREGMRSLAGKMSNGNGASIQIVWILPTLIGALSLGAFLWDKWRKPRFLGLNSVDAANIAPIFLLLCALFMMGSYLSKYLKPLLGEARKISQGVGNDSILIGLLPTMVNNVWFFLVCPLGLLIIFGVVGGFFLANAFPEVFLPVMQGLPFIGKVISLSANALFFYKILTAVIIVAGGIERMWETPGERGGRRRHSPARYDEGE